MTLLRDLPSSRRHDPTSDYPGEWLVFCNGRSGSFSTKREALDYAISLDETDVTVGWSCDPEDPRQGKPWFTGFYCDPLHSWL